MMGSKLDEACGILAKRFGTDYIQRGGLLPDYVRHSTGIDALDIILGGGMPERRIAMFAGEYSSSKTTAWITTAAQFQKKGKIVLLNSEGTFDPVWAGKYGLDVSQMIIIPPTCIEDLTDVAETLIMSGEVSLLIWDSIDSCPSKVEIEESAEKKTMGGIAKPLGLFMRKMMMRMHDPRLKLNTSLILVNHIRTNISSYGAAKYTPGGKALHDFSDIIVWFKRDSELVGGKDNPVGATIHCECKKNKTAAPFRIGTFDLMFKGWINNKKSIIESAIAYGLIKKSGSIYSWMEGKESKKAKGIDKLVAECTDKMVTKFKGEILEEIKKGNYDTTPKVDEEEVFEVTSA